MLAFKIDTSLTFMTLLKMLSVISVVYG